MGLFNLVDHSPQTMAELNRKIKLALQLIGEAAEGYAKDDCPVDTGRLRNSITYKVVDGDCYIGTNVKYAKYVEFNDRANHSPPQFGGGKAHFLRDAATTHTAEYKLIGEQTMRS